MNAKTDQKKISQRDTTTKTPPTIGPILNPHRLLTQKRNCVNFVDDLIRMRESNILSIQDPFLKGEEKSKLASIHGAWNILKGQLFDDVRNH